MFKILLRIFLVIFLLQLAYVVVLKWVDPPITVTQMVSKAQGFGLKKDYVKLEDISINAQLAAMAAEDIRFLRHHGFNLKRIKGAVKDFIYGRRQQGSSTISQQVAKNVFLWQGGGLFRKGMEAYLTLEIEAIWGKKRILEVYLNVIEMGDGNFGIEPASRHYFHKSAKDLTRQEAALIMCSLPNPKKYSIQPVSAFVANCSPRTLNRMNELTSLDSTQQFLGIRRYEKSF